MSLASSVSDECHVVMTLVIIYNRNMFMIQATGLIF